MAFIHLYRERTAYEPWVNNRPRRGGRKQASSKQRVFHILRVKGTLWEIEEGDMRR